MLDGGEECSKASQYAQVIQFLRNSGLTKTEQLLSKEAAELNLTDADADALNESILSLDSENVIAEYLKFARSLLASYEANRVELSVVLYPCFAHTYLRSVMEDHRRQATEFFKRCHHTVPALYQEQVDELTLVRTPAQALTSPIARALTNAPFIVRLTKSAMRILEGCMRKCPNAGDIINDHMKIEVCEATPTVAGLDDLGGLLGQVVVGGERKPKMLYAVPKDDLLGGGDKKRVEIKKKDPAAPPLDRFPLPAVPDSVRQERRLALKDAQQKRSRLGAENQPSVCLFSVMNASSGLCSAKVSENASMVALGFGDSTIRVDALSMDKLKVMKSASELELLDCNGDEAHMLTQMYDGGERVKTMGLHGHSGPIHSLSFSCERRLLLSASKDSSMRLWNLELQKNVVIYRTLAPVWQAEFCNRGYYFAASCADQTVSLWTTDRTQPLRIFTDALADVECISFHPNCNYIIGGSGDRYIRVWDVVSGTCVRTFGGHKGEIRSVKCSPCGRYLVSACSDGVIAIWDFAQQRMVKSQTCEAAIDFTVPIEFTKDSSVFAVGVPTHGVTFFSTDEHSSSRLHQSAEQGAGSDEAVTRPAMFSYPTKHISIYDLSFTRRNTLIAVGSYEH